MAHIIIVGDGPGGLSAALFLAKNGQEVTVFGQDKTAMHWAHLYNYLGIPSIGGTAFQEVAREQVAQFGAVLRDERVTAVTPQEDGFAVKTEKGGHSADYLILAEGKGARFSKELELDMTEAGVVVDRHGRTAVARLYVVGRGTRINRSQAIISAGDGAAAALDILSEIHGKDFIDFDTPPEDE